MTDLEMELQVREAIKRGDLSTVSPLIGADVSRRDMMTVFGTWLHVAASYGQLEIVKWLVESGADVDAYGGIAEGGALHRAASDGHYEVVQYLLDHGAVLDVSKSQKNPLFGAIHNGHTAIAKLLIDRGIDINVRYTGGSMRNMDALAFAREWGRSEIAEYLLAHGAVESQGPHRRQRDEVEDVVAYFQQRFGPVDPISLGELIPSTDPPIVIHKIRPTRQRNSIVLFTTGMSDRAMEVPPGGEDYRYAELLMELPADWPFAFQTLSDPNNRWPIDWLRRAASYPHMERTWLGGPVAIIANSDPPSPIAANCQFTSMLLAVGFGEVGPILLNDGRKVHVYTLFPLYEDERQLEMSQGLPELFRRLDQSGVGRLVDLSRRSVA